MKIHASKQWNLNYQWFIYYIPKSLLFLKKKNAFSYLYTFSKHTTIVPIHLDQILRLRCTDFTWIDNLYLHLKDKLFNSEIPNTYINYGNILRSWNRQDYISNGCVHFFQVNSLQCQSTFWTRCIYYLDLWYYYLLNSSKPIPRFIMGIYHFMVNTKYFHILNCWQNWT